MNGTVVTPCRHHAEHSVTMSLPTQIGQMYALPTHARIGELKLGVGLGLGLGFALEMGGVEGLFVLCR